MDRKDINDLFKLLEIYFPNSNKVNSETLKKAWLRLLEPYDRETVRSALVEQLRESKFFPDPQAVASRCPPVLRKDSTARRDSASEMSSWREQAELLKRYEKLIERRRAADVPATWAEAQAAGLSAMEWANQTSQVGLGVEGVL